VVTWTPSTSPKNGRVSSTRNFTLLASLEASFEEEVRGKFPEWLRLSGLLLLEVEAAPKRRAASVTVVALAMEAQFCVVCSGSRVLTLEVISVVSVVLYACRVLVVLVSSPTGRRGGRGNDGCVSEFKLCRGAGPKNVDDSLLPLMESPWTQAFRGGEEGWLGFCRVAVVLVKDRGVVVAPAIPLDP
jgi:hypothetical protein